MKKKVNFVIVIITIFALTGCLGNSSDSNVNDIESMNNDVLRTTDEIKNVLENVALPYTCGEESGLINIEWRTNIFYGGRGLDTSNLMTTNIGSAGMRFEKLMDLVW